MSEKTKDELRVHDTIISGACILWAIVSLFLMIYFTGLNKVTFSIMTFGQLFLIMGIVGLVRKNISGAVFTVTGLGTIILAALNEWGYLLNYNEDVWFFPIIISTAITFIGLAMMFIPGFLEKKASKKCKIEIDAECIDFKTTEIKDIMHYAPVYMYEYNGKNYTKCTNKYRKEKEIDIGYKTKLKINEKNPEEVYIETSKASKMLIYIFGFSFFIMGLGLILTCLSSR